MRLGIGIDTGGTYTDAVLYDFADKKILGSAKALTTRHDLSIGILGALDKLPTDFGKPDIVSISTTLATNACVENKMGRAKLFFFGGDQKTIDKYGGDYGLPPSEKMYIQDSGTTFSGNDDPGPDWSLFRGRAPGEIPELDGIGVIELYAMRNGACVEKQAEKILKEITDVPVVCGHELSSELSCLQRGAGTLLNASLFPIIKEFIAAIKRAMEARGMDAPVVIVRSDGSLMSDAFAATRPVETLLCGPAASVIGAMELGEAPDAVVVDMGGTTTDIAVVRNNVPVKAENGIGVGKWRTFVKGLYINTIGLGGDSAVHYADKELVLGSQRIIPLCIGCSGSPELLKRLRETVETVPFHTRYLHESFILLRDEPNGRRYTDFERRFCDALRGGPLLRRDAAAAVGRDEYTLDISRLLHEGVVGTCGLTPTDIMHLRGDFSRYPSEASMLGARFVAANLEISVSDLCERVYDEVKRKLYLNIVKALLLQENPEYRTNGPDESVEQMINDSYRAAASGGRGFLSTRFASDLKLIGIGAPVHIFLRDVAALLGTEAVIPEHSGVANALGAIVGKVHATHEILVRPIASSAGYIGVSVLDRDERRDFESREQAVAFAVAEAKRIAYESAVDRGACGEIAVNHQVEAQETHTKDGVVYLGTKVSAHAVGSVAL